MTDLDVSHSPVFGTVAVVGVGLIGGSFALALKKAGAVGRVLGVGRRTETLERAKTLGVIDDVASLEVASQEADLIMLAAPVGTFESLFSQMAAHLSDNTIITDGGSTKGNVVSAARAGLGHRIAQFVPAHPVAGSHESGPDAAFAELYRDRQVVICPLAENAQPTLDLVRAAWLATGARLVTLGVQQHDAVLAAVSHLPHWLASLYVEHVATDVNAQANLQLAGAGFGDFSRIAQGSVEMWRDIFLANRPAMLEQIDRMQRLLDEARQALAQEDVAWLESTLTHAADVRRAWGHGQYQKDVD